MNTKKIFQTVSGFRMGSRGDFGNLSGVALALVVFAIVVTVGALILNQFALTLPMQNTSSVAWNVTQLGLAGLQNLATYIPIIVIVAVAVVILSAIFLFGGRETSPE